DFPSVITIRVASVPGATFTHETGAGGSAGRSATAPGAAGAATAGAVPACCAFCAVAAVFFDRAATATVLDWVTGPSSPGLATRTEGTTFVGCASAASALAIPACSVVACCALACAGRGSGQSEPCARAVPDSQSAKTTSVATTQPLMRNQRITFRSLFFKLFSNLLIFSWSADRMIILQLKL